MKLEIYILSVTLYWTVPAYLERIIIKNLNIQQTLITLKFGHFVTKLRVRMKITVQNHHFKNVVENILNITRNKTRSMQIKWIVTNCCIWNDQCFKISCDTLIFINHHILTLQKSSQIANIFVNIKYKQVYSQFVTV